MKKLLTFTLALCMLLSMVVVSANATERTPLFDAPLEISYFCADENGQVPVTDDLWMFNQLTEYTNVTLKTIVAPIANYDEKLGTILASGQLPDLMALRSAHIHTKQYGPQGAFVNLKPYLDSGAMPNLKAYLDKIPNAYAMITAADGGIYEAPRIYDYTWVTESFIIRYDILAEVGMDVPKTTDEFYAFLKAVKEKYPDSTPMTNKWKQDHVLQAFSRAFNTDYDMYVSKEDGKWHYGPMEPQYRQMLEFAAKLYAEDLLDKEFATLADDQYVEKLVTGKSVAAYSYLVESANVTNMGIVDNPAFDLLAIPMLSSANGTRGVESLSSCYAQFGKAISAQSKYVEELVKFVDWTYSKEGVMLLGFGIEGDTYTMSDDILAYTEKANDVPKRQAIFLDNQNLLSVKDAAGLAVRLPQFIKSEEIVLTGAVSDPLPIVTFDDPEAMSNLIQPIRTFVQENAVKVITGSMSLEDWDKAIETLKTMKVEDVITMYQTAYDKAYTK